MQTIDTAIAYYDTTDANNTGWAYRVTYDDGTQSSGALDAIDHGAEWVAVIDLLQSVVEDHGGVWDSGTWAYRDGGDGEFIWTAED